MEGKDEGGRMNSVGRRLFFCLHLFICIPSYLCPKKIAIIRLSLDKHHNSRRNEWDQKALYSAISSP